MPLKRIVDGGAALTICGAEGDRYFEQVGEPGLVAAPFRWALERLPPGATVFDVGANIGLTSVLAARYARRVVAFEPSPANLPMLRATVEANGLGEVVSIEPVGVGAEAGELNFFDDPTTGSASHLLTSATLGRAPSHMVPITTLDRFVRAQGVDRLDLVKVDVEGFEIDVLAGGAETFRTLRPACVVEFNAFTMIGFRDLNPRRFLEVLRATFPHLYRWADGPVAITTDADALTFVHDNLVRAGCVDDLLGTFDPVA